MNAEVNVFNVRQIATRQYSVSGDSEPIAVFEIRIDADGGELIINLCLSQDGVAFNTTPPEVAAVVAEPFANEVAPSQTQPSP